METQGCDVGRDGSQDDGESCTFPRRRGDEFGVPGEKSSKVSCCHIDFTKDSNCDLKVKGSKIGGWSVIDWFGHREIAKLEHIEWI
jgi:hypothetical protein